MRGWPQQAPDGAGMTTLSAKPEPMLQRLRALLSARGADLTSPEGRAAERHRRAAMTAAASVLAKLLSVATALISIPLTLHYLGAERFGMWMTISSLVALLSFADFGIANGVLNLVADAHGRDDREGIRRAIASGMFILGGVSLALLGAFYAAYAWVDWPRVFNVKSSMAAAEAGPALAVFVSCYAAMIPLIVVQRAQMGLQQGFLTSVWQCLGSLCGLMAVLLAIHLQAGLPWLVLAFIGAPFVAALLNTAHFFVKSRPDLRPGSLSVSRATCRAVSASGILFFLLQLAAAVAYTSDNVVIANLLGASAVAEYAVTEKLFSLLSVAVAMALGPLWPAYGEAIARGDSAWVTRTVKRSFFMAVAIAGAGSLILIALGPFIVRLWVKDAVVPAFGLLWALGCWKVVEAGGTAIAMFLNGANVIRLQLACALCTAVAALVLKLVLVPEVGVAGAAWASVVAFVLLTALPVALRLRGLVRGLNVRRSAAP
jgi:O-antigen/teichoic acid export membrane protein